MATSENARKLATIVALDVAGYSARTEADEATTAAEVTALRKVIEEIAVRHGGRVFNTAGDGFMLEFGSSLAAVEAAFELAETCEPKVRVGVHLGDVVVQGNGDLLGHGVNVAARLMAQSAPGSALVSADVRRTIRGPLAERLVSRGSLKLDKMAETIEAFALAAVASGIVAAQPKSAEPLLAVLPFDNLSDDREMQFFSDGVSEEIMQTVARGTKLKVIGRSSSFQLRGADKAIGNVVRALKATHVLDGAVRRSGSRVRISAQLIEAASQTTMWSDRFDRDLTDIFSLQDEIAAAVAAALQQAFFPVTPVAADPIAYDLFLRGRAATMTGTQSSQLTAIQLLLEAVKRAPAFAPAWGALSLVHSSSRRYERDANAVEALRALAREEANKALALDPSNTLAYWTMGNTARPTAHLEKLELANRAMIQAPNDASAMQLLGASLGSIGKVRESLAFIDKSFELDPLDWNRCWAHAWSLSARGEDNAGIAFQEETVSRWPETTFSASTLILWRAFRSDWARVEELLAPERLSRFPLHELGRFTLSLVEMLRSPSEETRAAVIDLIRRTAKRRGIQFLAMVYCSRAGLSRQILDLLQENDFSPFGQDGVISEDRGLHFLFYPRLMGGEIELRRDPRFVRLCGKLGLVKYWIETQTWPDCVEEVARYYDFKAECAKVASEPL